MHCEFNRWTFLFATPTGRFWPVADIAKYD